MVRKVLLVDDEEDIRTIGALALADVGGWEVVQASSGPEALALAAADPPDLVLLDVMMPGMSGASVMQRLARVCAAPVIFMTAKVQKSEIERYLDLGAVGVIAKPFDPMTLPERIRGILSRH